MDARKIKEANQSGLNGKGGGLWSYYTPTLQVAYDMGCSGVSIQGAPIVSGIRYGATPASHLSTNYRDGRSERGLSVAQLDGEPECASSVWFAGREPVRVNGILLPYRGSDGEALILSIDADDLD